MKRVRYVPLFHKTPWGDSASAVSTRTKPSFRLKECTTPMCPFKGSKAGFERHKRLQCREHDCPNVPHGCPMKFLTLPELHGHRCDFVSAVSGGQRMNSWDKQTTTLSDEAQGPTDWTVGLRWTSCYYILKDNFSNFIGAPLKCRPTLKRWPELRTARIFFL